MERTAKIVKVLPEQRFNGKNGEIVKNSSSSNGMTVDLTITYVSKSLEARNGRK